MWSNRIAFDSDACPVGEDFFGSLYRASGEGLQELVVTVPSNVRAMLALFCYRRAHLHAMSLAIAATCTERELIDQGGIVGSTLYAMSREQSPAQPAPSNYGNRRAISLSTKPLKTFAEFDDTLDDEPAPMTA